jgi:Rps23 Pro-64 3,4-dihydroxylase Tpa1-like proline 4-hydroxylase
MPAAFDLSPRPDLPALKERLRSTGRVRVPAIFPHQTAQNLWTVMAKETEWSLAVNDDQQSHELRQAQISALNPEALGKLAGVVRENAQRKFQYLYDTFLITERFAAGDPMPHLYRQFYQHVNSAAFLAFTHELTGDTRINHIDMHATRYRPGHFLTTHHDAVEGKNRLYAYVFNFSPSWRSDWGGLLLFQDADGHVLEGFNPVFNALNVFKVPTPHSVSMVTPSAAEARYSFTGWFRGMESPPSISAPA